VFVKCLSAFIVASLLTQPKFPRVLITVAQWCLTKQKTILQKQQNDYWHLCWQLDWDGFWRLNRLARSEVTAPDEEVKGYHPWGQGCASSTCTLLPSLWLFPEQRRSVALVILPFLCNSGFNSLDTWTWRWHENHHCFL